MIIVIIAVIVFDGKQHLMQECNAGSELHLQLYLASSTALVTRYGSILEEGDRLVNAMMRIDERATAIATWTQKSEAMSEMTAYFNKHLPYEVGEYRIFVGH